MPIYGSLWILLLGAFLYMLVSLGMGLVISSITRNQFAASQVALLVSYLPTVMLSGFIFDLNNAPLVIQWIGKLLPATHFMDLVKTLLLAGDISSVIVKDCGILAAYALVFFVIAQLVTRKSLD